MAWSVLFHRSILDEVFFPRNTAWKTTKVRRYLREGGTIVHGPLSPQFYHCKWREKNPAPLG